MACLAALAAGAAHAFGFDEVAERARAEASRAYQVPRPVLPPELAALSYDHYRDIRFQPAQALWRPEALPFELMFFHVGGLQTQPVVLNELVDGKPRHLGFNPADYSYGQNRLNPAAWPDLGHAGFRVHHALNTPDYKDELAVFLGASYFRALGAGQRYGLSARGLAIDTVGGQGEEFPRFKEFWIERPAAGAQALTLYALLDSPRATGAYRFTLVPGRQTEVQVQARLFLRAGVATLGLAPLTSMFLHGENTARHDDFRPEVHDSDGLMLATADAQGAAEWLWRPLINPARALASSFTVHELKGFGLMQRDRAFASYEDLEARYERRPSAWVVPQGHWGPGRVELLQLPTLDEAHDNIVAYWVPARPPAPGQPLDIAYRLLWQGDDAQRPPNGWTVQSRTGRGFNALGPGELQYVIDFAGPALDALPADAAVEAVVTPGPNGRVLERNAYRNDARGGWRMTLRVQRLTPTQPLELRAFLQHGPHALTETWTTLIPAD
ncbi:MAG TPA: glucan biosynthesis protein G [Burkholderiaceae bacterium]|nr:glucan biosynthesis protein G [Burkholderiaceae bacterium]